MRVEAMKRRSRAGQTPAKARPRSALRPKGRTAPKTLSNRRSAVDNSESEVARLKRELREASEQQTATSEVLQVISSSLGELQPVFAAMLEKAVRICDASFGGLWRWDGNALHQVATHNTPVELAAYRKASPLRPNPKSASGRMVATKTVVHVADIKAEPGYTEERDSAYVAAVELGGVRTFLSVPMLKEGELIGAFALSRQEVRPFTDKQIALLTNFAAQAVIAIENARLLNELKESLEQQTATSEVLQVISSSPGELERVFTAMLANATRICEAQFGNFMLREGSTFRAVAWHGEPTYVENLRREPLITIRPCGRI
jgi:transcriptional regulator with GAF, ATPase, and Fis domain